MRGAGHALHQMGVEGSFAACGVGLEGQIRPSLANTMAYCYNDTGVAIARAAFLIAPTKEVSHVRTKQDRLLPGPTG